MGKGASSQLAAAVSSLAQREDALGLLKPLLRKASPVASAAKAKPLASAAKATPIAPCCPSKIRQISAALHRAHGHIDASVLDRADSLNAKAPILMLSGVQSDWP